MPSKQIRDILDHVRDFKHQLVELYEKLGQMEQDEKQQLLLKYLGRQEEQIARTLDGYEPELSKGILNTWVQFVDDEALRTISHDVQVHAGMTPEELIERSLQFDAALVQVYRDVIESTSAPHLQEVFMNLIEMEESKDRQNARSLLD